MYFYTHHSFAGTISTAREHLVAPSPKRTNPSQLSILNYTIYPNKLHLNYRLKIILQLKKSNSKSSKSLFFILDE